MYIGLKDDREIPINQFLNSSMTYIMIINTLVLDYLLDYPLFNCFQSLLTLLSNHP